MALHSEEAKQWLEQFMADVGLRWWPYVAHRANRNPGRFPQTVAGISEVDAAAKGSGSSSVVDESDSYWAARVRDLRSITGAASGIPDAVSALPAKEMAPVSKLTPKLATLGRMVLGPLLREFLTASRYLERLERVNDLDENWLPALGMLFEYSVMAKYLGRDLEDGANGSAASELESARRFALDTIARLQGEASARENVGRTVNDRLQNIQQNTDVLSILIGMAGNRDKALVMRFLELNGNGNTSFTGKALPSELKPEEVMKVCRELDVPDWQQVSAAARGAGGEALFLACDDEAKFDAAVKTLNATLPPHAREAFLDLRPLLTNRNRAIALYKKCRRDKISLAGLGHGDDGQDYDYLDTYVVQQPSRDDDEEAKALIEAMQVRDGTISDDSDTGQSSEPFDHQRSMALALMRLEEPDLQLLWSLMRWRVAVIPNATGNGITERDTVYAVASGSTRWLLEFRASTASGEGAAHMAKICGKLKNTHVSFAVGGDRTKLFVEIVQGAVVWFIRRKVDATLIRKFELSENGNGGFTLSPGARRQVGQWKMDLRKRCANDDLLKKYLLPAIYC